MIVTIKIINKIDAMIIIDDIISYDKPKNKGEKQKNVFFFANVNKNKATLHRLTLNPKKFGYGLTLTL